jgi:hypothetical protein
MTHLKQEFTLSGFGYDPLNEPQRWLDTDYDRARRERLLLLLRRMTDTMRKTIPVPVTTNWMTWVSFSDNSPAGRVERKHITASSCVHARWWWPDNGSATALSATDNKSR